jgi:hypothetical protein
MVKAKATMSDGRAMIVLGISEGNVTRLRRGHPLYFDPSELRIEPGTVIGAITLFYGGTDAELGRTLCSLIGPETEVIVVPRGDPRPT